MEIRRRGPRAGDPGRRPLPQGLWAPGRAGAEDDARTAARRGGGTTGGLSLV